MSPHDFWSFLKRGGGGGDQSWSWLGLELCTSTKSMGPVVILTFPCPGGCNIKLCNQLLFSNQLQKCCWANHGYCYTRDMMKHDLWLAELQFCNWLLNSNWLQSFMLHLPDLGLELCTSTKSMGPVVILTFPCPDLGLELCTSTKSMGPVVILTFPCLDLGLELCTSTKSMGPVVILTFPCPDLGLELCTSTKSMGL